METTGRLLRLLSHLQARPTWTGSELARRLEVTERTLRRDITRLRDLGYPVEATPGRHGGYRLVPGGALPPLLLNDEEAVAVAWGLRAAAAGSVPGFEDQALMALAKIEQVLPSSLRERIRTLAEATVQVDSTVAGESSLQLSSLMTIARAARAPERMRFAYTDGSGRESERHVEPYQLVHTRRRWYLYAWDRDREDWRSFRVDRITGPKATGMRFERREAPDAALFVAEGMAVGAYRLQARILLDLPHSEARRLVSPVVGVLEPHEDRTLMRIGADDPAWIARYLAGLPCRFSILEPEEVRRAVAEVAGRLGEDARR
ncbi:MAG: helix-turn-helix transcriptional regulator [Actinomycetota bacterium]